MLQKVRSGFGYVSALVGAVCLAVLYPSVASAAGESTAVTITQSAIDWSQLPTQFVNAIMVPLVVAIGIGLSILIVMLGVKFFRRGMSV